MKKWWMLMTIVCSTILAQAQGEVELLKKVKDKLNTVNDYQAKGRMKIDVSFINAPESDVTVYFKKPNKLRVKKEGGISLLPKGGVSLNLQSLLMGDQYAVVPGGSAVVDGITTKMVKLLPLQETSDVVLTTLWIDEKEALIRKTSVTTKESGTYEMAFTYGKMKQWGLPDKVVFTFSTKDYKMPKGITFEYEKGTKKQPIPKDAKGRVEIVYNSYVVNKGVSEEVFR